MTDDAGTTSNSSFWAFLVGIDEYAAVTNLRGCVNDVEAVRLFLMNQLGVPEEQIRVLRNAEATRANILGTFQEFLIENSAVRPGDQILFHYSGHGSQMLDSTGLEPDGYNETLVAHDSRTPGVYDIPDKTLAALLDRLAASKGHQVTVVLDSCHSGSGTRRLEAPGVALTRRVPADFRLPPADLDAELSAGTATRGAGPSGWATAQASYVLLAGCRDREESNEYQAPENIWHGALTYFTLDYLKGLAPNTTYADLHEQVAASVNAHYRNQMPQCEGDVNRVVFGGTRVERDPFLVVQQVEGDSVTLAAGLVHGLRPGTRLDLYPPETRTRAELPDEPLATVEVTSVSATTSRADVRSSSGQPIPVRARALVTRQVYSGARQTVALEAAEGEENERAIEWLREEIEPSTSDKKPSPYLELVADSDATAQLRVRADGGTLNIYAANGELLVEPEDLQDPESPAVVRRALDSIARYRAILDLSNDAPGSQVAGKVKVRLRRCLGGAGCPEAEEAPVEPTGGGGELTLYYDPEREDRNHYVVDVVNESSVPIYPHIFTMSADYGIARLYPLQSQQEQLQPGRTLSSGLPRSGGSGLEVYLPGDLPGEARWDSSRDYLKVIVTTEPADLAALEQRPLEVPPPSRGRRRTVRSSLDELLDTVLAGRRTRHVRPARPAAGEDWATVTVPITVVRADQTKRLEPPPGRIELSDGLTLVKPEGFQGEVTVTTWGQATRGTEGDPTLKPPPGLERHPDLFEPLRRAQTRSVGPSGLVIALDVDEASRRSISPENPLRLEFPPSRAAREERILAVAFDGEDYLLAGYASEDGAGVEIVNLPAPVVPVDVEGRPTRRGIGRTIRLFLYKQTGRHTDLIGLHRAELEGGKVVYQDVDAAQFKAGDTVALFVHGFTSDSAWMIQGPAQTLRREVRPYDHLLTWDYESYGTSVADNGEQLALALKQQCGFGPDDGITVHVYAHSMGCLVSRCMIELSGGHEFVDRLTMAGPPNRGTTLATLTRGGVYLISSLINRYSIIPPVAGLNWLVKEVYQKGTGWADIAVDSEIVRRLNALDEPSSVEYLVLAGENLPDPNERNALNRLAHKILDKTLDEIFGEQNDAVIGMSSMRGVRGEAYPRLRIEVLPCQHSHYFGIPQTRDVVRQWVLA